MARPNTVRLPPARRASAPASSCSDAQCAATRRPVPANTPAERSPAGVAIASMAAPTDTQSDRTPTVIAPGATIGTYNDRALMRKSAHISLGSVPQTTSAHTSAGKARPKVRGRIASDGGNAAARPEYRMVIATIGNSAYVPTTTVAIHCCDTQDDRRRTAASACATASCLGRDAREYDRRRAGVAARTAPARARARPDPHWSARLLTTAATAKHVTVVATFHRDSRRVRAGMSTDSDEGLPTSSSSSDTQ